MIYTYDLRPQEARSGSRLPVSFSRTFARFLSVALLRGPNNRVIKR